MRRIYLLVFALMLWGAVSPPTFALEDDDLFGEEPAAEAPADAPTDAPAAEPAADAGDDLFGESETPAEEAAADAAPANEPAKEEPAAAGDDLFGEPETPAADVADDKTPAEEKAEPKGPAADASDDLFGEPAAESDPVAPAKKSPVAARKPHTREEIKAELTKRNPIIADQFARFIELNKEVFKQAVVARDQAELMPILREYAPAVLRAKQIWTTIAGNPAKYDSWLDNPEYRQAWSAFHRTWQSLYGYTERIASVDIGVADKVSDALMALGTSFQDYNDWVDEWDAEIGNDHVAFARGNDHLNELAQDQFREEQGAQIETEQAAADQTREEEDETAPSEVEEAQQATEEADADTLKADEASADAAADEAVADEEMKEDEAADGEAPDGQAAPKEEAPADDDFDFGDGKA